MKVYGSHAIPKILKHGDFSLSIEEFGDHFIYKREVGQKREKKLLLGKRKKIRVNPVEAVTKPKHITPFFLIDFNKPAVIDARTSRILYLTFPIEIAFPQRREWFANELKSAASSTSESKAEGE